MAEMPIVQFSSAMYFCKETDPVMPIDALRIGSCAGRSVVHWRTSDGTAKAGFCYQQTSGVITFEPGDSQIGIEVPILNVPQWTGTTEFVVEMCSDPPHTGCQLGRYLWTSRIKIIDENAFPSDRFKQALLAGHHHSIPDWTLFWEYLCLALWEPVMRIGIKKMFMADQAHNFYFLLRLFMNVYLVDEVLRQTIGTDAVEPRLLIPSQEANLMLIAGLLLAPFALLHYIDFREKHWKVGGCGRLQLQRALIRKYLNLHEASRAKVNLSDLLMSITRDSVVVVHEGLVGSVHVVKSLGELLAILSFQMLAPAIFAKEYQGMGILIIILFPMILVSFLLLRRNITGLALRERNLKQDGLVDRVDRTVKNLRMIADYNRRPFFVDKFEMKVADFNKADRDLDIVMLNNIYFASWLTQLFTAFYTVMGGIEVLNGSVSLGMFLANVSIIGQIGASCGSIYKTLMMIQGTFPALEKVARILNLPTDLPQRMALKRDSRKRTSQLRTELRATMLGHSDGIPIDFLPITVSNVDFSYGNDFDEGTKDPQAFNSSGELLVQQGQIVAIVGRPECGKSTILKLIGGVLLPKPGGFLVPAHLRVLNVAAEPYFFQGSLFDNMRFGINGDDPDGRKERVKAIMEKAGSTQQVLGMVDAGFDGPVLQWTEVLSHSQKSLCMLVRGVVTNPEILCIHKPTMACDEGGTAKVMSVLCEFVQNKGVVQDPETRHHRRPRTCIMTSSKLLGLEVVDALYMMSRENGIEAVPMSKRASLLAYLA
eukprot:gnl/TRDRNA2_/TRDRNA2_171837_c2_seq3.p1 gnl/TRDRNA2_/TRDRNA2_171837_c2~~gnl/TRDRNA2_/TRDRNA2_171837_c2_seq3.p1  ORF type:complete len:887 (+),score=135.99 gnl/TRDRNA2_/TRDRNA2_171837_c2_seq3:363-2663(+)